MKLHTTSLNRQNIEEALQQAKTLGRVAPRVQTFIKYRASRIRDNGYDVQLGVRGEYTPPLEGTLNPYGKPYRTRRRSRDPERWAATWQEWGWFIYEIFQADQAAVFGYPTPPTGGQRYGGYGYDSMQDFQRKTNYRFDPDNRYDPTKVVQRPTGLEPIAREPEDVRAIQAAWLAEHPGAVFV